jgi:predicted XRE-type DNA-binding protein
MITEAIQNAIESSGVSRYAISKATGIDQSQLTKFMQGQGGLSLASVDTILNCLRLTVELKPRDPRKGV